MNIINTHKDLPIAFLGDIHDKWNVINNKIKQYQLDNLIIFQLGDFGVGFNYNDPRMPGKERTRLIELNKFLKRRKIFLYVVRGNHDNPIFFDGTHNFTNVIFMQDYDVVEVGERRIVGIGGATSVDRKPNNLIIDYRGKAWPGRRKDISWWPNEKVVYNEEKIRKLFGINIIIAHTAPDFAYPLTFDKTGVNKWIDGGDPELETELPVERALMTKIFNEIDKHNAITHFVYGHFHQTKIEKRGLVNLWLLDVDEFRELRIERDVYQ